MRPRLEKILPVAVLAVTLQALAPLLAFLTVAVAADPLRHAALCSELASSETVAGPVAPASPSHGVTCCTTCGALAGGVAFVDPPSIGFLIHPREFRPIGWRLTTDSVLPDRAAFHAKARAPPLRA